MCPMLTDPADGQVVWTGLTPDSTATYTCDEGFELNGTQTRTCQSDGTWSGDPPTCERMYKHAREVCYHRPVQYLSLVMTLVTHWTSV